MRLVLFLTFLLTVASFENCSNSGAGGFSVNSATGSSATTPLTASPISLPTTSVPVGTALSPSIVISGTNLTSITCTWNIINQSNQVLSSTVGTLGNSGSFCSGSLNAPASPGTYGLTVVVTNSGGESSTTMASFTATSTSTTVDPLPTPTPAPPVGPDPTPVPTATPLPVSGLGTCHCCYKFSDGSACYSYNIPNVTQDYCSQLSSQEGSGFCTYTAN